MSIVINEFEIVTEEPASSGDEDETTSSRGRVKQLRPRDVVRIVDRERKRRRRVRAH